MTKPIIVPGEGPLDCAICFIGEAPGEKEEKEGRPFVGKAGGILNGLLSSTGISRTRCRITNVIKERPPKNDISKFIVFKKNRGEPTPEYNEWERRLYAELAQVKANVLVPLGRVPLYALTREVHITQWRGSILEGVNGRKVIPTLHPSSLQYVAGRTYTHYRTALGFDLRRILNESRTPDITLPKRNLLTSPSYEEAMAFLTQCAEAGQVGFDIETSTITKEVLCLAFALSPSEAMSIPFCYRDGRDYFSIDKEAEIWLAIERVLSDESITKIGQNLIFDSSWLFRKYGIITRNMDDTMIAQGIIAPDLPKGLDFLASIMTKEPYYKGEGKARMKSDKTPDERFWEYNCKDAAVCMEILPIQERKLKLQKNSPAYNIHTRLISPLSFMGEAGMRVDVERLRVQSRKVKQAIEDKTAELKELCGLEINPNSSQQVAEYFYIKKGLSPYKTRGKRPRITTNEDALKRIARKGYKEAQLILDIRGLVKTRSTYLEVSLDEDQRLRTAFNPVGTSSGRPASAKTLHETGADTQNMIDELKVCIIPDDGYILYNLDLAQAENRVVAYVAPELNMIEAFEAGQDIHKQTGRLIFSRVAIEAGTDERTEGKRCNHGLNYGYGYKSFALRYGMQESYAKTIVERYHEIYPGVRDWHGRVRDQVDKTRTLTQLFGRSRLFLGRLDDDLYREAYSFIPQSTVAQITNEWGVLYIYENQGLFDKVWMLNTVYDSITLQIPLETGWQYHVDVLTRIKESLEQTLRTSSREFIIPVEVEMGANLMDMMEVELTVKGLEEAYGKVTA